MMPDYDPDVPDPLPRERALGEPFTEYAQEEAARQTDAAIRFLNDPGVAFHVYHSACAPQDETPLNYTIGCSRVERPEYWAAWVRHMAEKNWMKKRDIVSMVLFWYRAHGQRVPDDLT